MSIVLYFGSFNPIHIGHLVIANHVLNNTEAERLWFVVSPQNPFKRSATLLNEYDRLHLIQKAIAGDDRLRASDIEFKLPKPSYTATTLAYLKEKHPTQVFQILMGSDSFQNFINWKNYEAILSSHKLLIYKRPGFDVINTIAADIDILDAPLLDISATYVRHLLTAGKSIRYLVPAAIEDELTGNHFFKLKKDS